MGNGKKRNDEQGMMGNCEWDNETQEMRNEKWEMRDGKGKYRRRQN